MIPTTRTQFKDYCLRSLGSPVLQINVTNEQVEDRIDEAISFYRDYHFDATDLTYYKVQVTQQDKDNGYFTLPENIIGAVDVFPIGWTSSSTTGLFSAEYQMIAGTIIDATNQSLVPYYSTMQYISVMQEILTGMQPFRYTRHSNRIYIDMNWDKAVIGRWIIIKAYSVIDPDIYTDMWKDRFLYRYTTQLIKRQWGTNLSKMVITLPGNIQ
jgi:hypothetical protein